MTTLQEGAQRIASQLLATINTVHATGKWPVNTLPLMREAAQALVNEPQAEPATGKESLTPQQAQQAQGVPPDRVFQLADAHAEESYENGDRRFDRGGLIQFAKELLAAAPQAEPALDKTRDHLSTMIGLVLGARQRGAAYEAGSAIDKAVQEAIEHLKDWPQAPAVEAEPQPEREPTTWSRYVAGMIACYLKWPDDDERTEAVAGIIERRRWSDRRTKSEPLSHVESESLQWLERLCEPALYLDRLGPIRDYLRAHGIGTKGGDTK